MTRTSGAAERYPAWSPDGKYIAYWSDQSGEYELWMMEADKENSAKKLTTMAPVTVIVLSGHPIVRRSLLLIKRCG